MEAEPSAYACAYCGELNETLVDLSAGVRQVYVEDCSVCCHPNVLNVRIDPESGSIAVEAGPEE